jgi:RecB family endonuclease NucS
MSASEVEVLYYFLNNAVLLGESNDAKMYLEMLRHEFSRDESSFSILEDRFSHLIQLGHAVDNNLVIRNFDYKDDTKDVEAVETDDDKMITEHDLVINLIKNSNILKKVLHASDDFHIYNIEHPTRFGRVDLVARDKSTMYLIECKKKEARYSVISQIDKYILDFKLKLILKMWTRIVGVVIANGFLNHVIRELVKLDVIPIKYTFKHDKLKLKKVRDGQGQDNNS